MNRDELLKEVIAVLRKQPPKVIKHEYGTEYRCSCGTLIVFCRNNEELKPELKSSKNFCSYCGTAIDWNYKE